MLRLDLIQGFANMFFVVRLDLVPMENHPVGIPVREMGRYNGRY